MEVYILEYIIYEQQGLGADVDVLWVFSTKELAEEAKENHVRNEGLYSYYNIYEKTLNKIDFIS